MARDLFGPDGEKEIGAALATVSAAILAGTRPGPLSNLPEFHATDMRPQPGSLVEAGRGGAG
jgi:hypothetical protein